MRRRVEGAVYQQTQKLLRHVPSMTQLFAIIRRGAIPSPHLTDQQVPR
jgi:hypothetical protein